MVSVIIPTYNSGDKLDRCLKSIADQSYTDFECIIVDDGSSDGSAEMARDNFKSDSRFKFIFQSNSGVSSARNIGITNALGDFISFVDSDDFVDPNHIENLVTCLGNSDLSICGYLCHMGTNINEVNPHTSTNIMFTDSFVPDIANFLRCNAFFGPCAKLYRKSIIASNNIRFPNGIDYGEDLLFNFSYLNHCKKISSSSHTTYHYLVESTGLSSKQRKDYWEINSKQWSVIKNFFESRGILSGEIKLFIFNRLAGIVYDSIFQTITQPGSFITKFRRIKSYLLFQGNDTKDFRYAVDNLNCSHWISFSIKHKLVLPFLILGLR